MSSLIEYTSINTLIIYIHYIWWLSVLRQAVYKYREYDVCTSTETPICLQLMHYYSHIFAGAISSKRHK